MANTNDLKNVIEPALLEGFRKSEKGHQVVQTAALRRELFGMEFDGIGLQPQHKTLCFLEATVSGYLGHNGRDFHIGASKKFADAFARFSIVMFPPTKAALLKAATQEFATDLENINCHLVVPKGSRFIRALGYRTRLLEMGIMRVTEIELPEEEREILMQALNAARDEMT
ncbi:MAG: hypothetical protein E8D41_02655 [Nitrospira sp.]|nr:MAG: hypothetical protein E8D41_02655 [Nitrospira sp.]